MLLVVIGFSDWGVDIFRNDRNTNPLPFWKYADGPDRQGITEIRQIEGFYQLWDGLLERFPKLEIIALSSTLVTLRCPSLF